MACVHFDGLRARPEIIHCISRRDSTSPEAGSLALHTGQEADAIRANRHAFGRVFGPSAHFCSPLQVHGDHVAVVTEAADRGWNTLDRTFEADALVTDLPGVVLTILTADCVPVLLYDPIRRAVGAVHAGWRGTHARIVPRTVETMQKRYGTDPRDLIVGIGPAIGGCCYEVGPEVAERFVAYPDALLPQTGGKYRLDTKETNRIQLIEIGVPETHIEVSPICTMCEHDHYFSYRADATAGRFMSGIMIGGE